MRQNTTHLTRRSPSDTGNVLSSASTFYFHKVENRITSMRYIPEFVEKIQIENMVIAVFSVLLREEFLWLT